MSNSYDLPIIEDIISSVVDSIRDTGTITNVVFASGISTITTVNSLSNGEVVVIGSLEGKIKNVSSTEFQIEGDATGELSWKAQAPYFIDGHLLDVANQLLQKDGSVAPVKFKKYPLIVLEQDYAMNKFDGPLASASLNFVIVNQTKAEYTTEQRREFNFTPVLDPLYAEFIEALSSFTGVTILSENWEITRRYYWGSQLAEKNIFNDKLDAIEIKNLEIETTINC